MKLVWNKTGDEIACDVLQPTLAEYYSKQQLDEFRTVSKVPDYQSLQKSLAASMEVVNNCLLILRLPTFEFRDDWSQEYLNQLHADWVNLYKKHPTINIIANKIVPDAYRHFESINDIVHTMENSFKISITNGTTDPISNIFGEKILSLGKANVMIDYQNLGRSSYDKWMNFGDRRYEDTNDFSELFGRMVINLEKPFDLELPRQYIDWCKQQELIPVGEKVKLANFKDLEENLTSYRKMWIHNFTIEDNHIFFAY